MEQPIDVSLSLSPSPLSKINKRDIKEKLSVLKVFGKSHSGQQKGKSVTVVTKVEASACDPELGWH